MCSGTSLSTIARIHLINVLVVVRFKPTGLVVIEGKDRLPPVIVNVIIIRENQRNEPVLVTKVIVFNNGLNGIVDIGRASIINFTVLVEDGIPHIVLNIIVSFYYSVVPLSNVSATAEPVSEVSKLREVIKHNKVNNLDIGIGVENCISPVPQIGSNLIICIVAVYLDVIEITGSIPED